MPVNDHAGVRDYYDDRIAKHQTRLDEISRAGNRLTWARVGTFLIAAVFASFAFANPPMWILWTVLAVLVFIGFMVLVRFHEQLNDEAAEVRHRLTMNRTQLARLDRRWDDFPIPTVDVPELQRAVARDLDLAGRASVFQLIALAHTPIGKATLMDWLVSPALPDEIHIRQQAVQALTDQAALREEFDLRGRQLGAVQSGPVEFLRWAEGPCWLADRGWLLWTARGLSLAVVIGIVTAIVTGSIAAWLVVAAILLLNLAVNVLFTGNAVEIFNRVSSRNHSIQHYRALFQAIAELQVESPFLDRMKSKLGSTPTEPVRYLDRLMGIIGFANLRRDGAFGVLYLVIQLFFLVDIHLLHWLEAWQRDHGKEVRTWLSAVGQLEAISSLATLAHDHPRWVLPTVEHADEKTIEAKAVGHPLLGDQECVRNDVTVGPTGSFLLVTGSNMSGKSTLLRSLGVNVALAQAGGPVCAEAFRIPPLKLATSMRIDDSLAEGVSFFMAELKRLKQIVDQCLEIEPNADWTQFYLLDEILQGTNSAERHIAVARVIGHLISHRAIGAVSTHDLDLATAPELASAAKTVHFRETLDSSGSATGMTFDHIMRPGVTPTTNALKLLELVGLADVDEER